MSKARRRTRHPAAPPRQAHARPAKTPRHFHVRPYRLLRGLLITLAILAVPMAWLVVEERHARQLADLSVIGSGEPVVVQVFDQRRRESRRLRDNAEQALANLDRPPAWRVVNINTTEGTRFANQHLVGPVTLVLFDAVGRRSRVIEGAASVDELEAAFRAL
ncbi:hypothetical protein EQG41_01275 [Billgrantia azerbaijanica]|nr:hypothetical protein EQG41_01275 [Halomonas azerbaijanica]